MAIKRLLPMIGTGKVAMATRRVEKVKIYLRRSQSVNDGLSQAG